MNREFIPYQIALDMKSIEFDEPCFMFYEQGTKDKYLQQGVDDDYWGDYSEPRDWNSIPNKPWKPFCQCISAPLYQQAFRWFREKYGLEHKILRDTYGCRYQITKVTPTTLEDIDFKGQYSNTSYDEAELECLKKLIEICKKN
jgi:hypothetical protein